MGYATEKLRGSPRGAPPDFVRRAGRLFLFAQRRTATPIATTIITVIMPRIDHAISSGLQIPGRTAFPRFAPGIGSRAAREFLTACQVSILAVAPTRLELDRLNFKRCLAITARSLTAATRRRSHRRTIRSILKLLDRPDPLGFLDDSRRPIRRFIASIDRLVMRDRKR